MKEAMKKWVRKRWLVVADKLATYRHGLVKWVKNYWLKAVIVVLSPIALATLLVLIAGLSGIFEFHKKNSASELLVSFVLCLGGIGGAYGLHLAKKRQQILLEKGVNDSLGRGIELLSNEGVGIRCTGLRILTDLLDNSNEAQKIIVANIIYDFFHDKVVIRSDDDSIFKEKSYEDAQIALNFLINLSLDEREKLLPNRLIGDKLNLMNLDFSHLHFTNQILEEIDFRSSEFKHVIFSRCEIRRVHFNDKIINSDFNYGSIVDSLFAFAIIEGSSFNGMVIEKTSFINAKMIGTTFLSGAVIGGSSFNSTVIEKTSFINVEMTGAKFPSVKFMGGEFKIENKIKVSEKSSLPKFICTDFGSTEFDFSDKISPEDFFDLCCHDVNKWTASAYNLFDKTRGYKGGRNNIRFFIKSSEDWSGQPAILWTEVEYAQWKIEQIESEGGTQDDVIVAKAELKTAISTLRQRQKEFDLPQKTPAQKSKPPTPRS